LHVKLVVFDLDGTLLDTNAIDSQCFIQAWLEAGIDCSDADWSSFEHVTDTGIALELLAGANVSNCDETVERVRQRFVKLLEEAAVTTPSAFSPIKGAPEMLQRLAEAGWAAVIATGAWAASAAPKIRAASLPPLPLVSSDDHPTRQGIVERALALRGESFSRIVLVGDAPWDVDVARKLQLPFVGIARSGQRDVLIACGASHVLPDFASFNAVVAALESAEAPGS
jgi:phosphoglycolate phosphatase-like HAD superfamily hydrolase